LKKLTVPKVDTSYFTNQKPIGLLATTVASKYEANFLMLVTSDKLFSSISSSDHAILRFLAFENLTSVELSRKLGISKQAIGKTVSSLEERGFIERRENEMDKRKQVLAMTEKGTKLIAKSIVVAKELEHRTEKLLGVKNFSLLKNFLNEIVNSTDFSK
jgi:DNA-binding MarR family transcriptional regulator